MWASGSSMNSAMTITLEFASSTLNLAAEEQSPSRHGVEPSLQTGMCAAVARHPDGQQNGAAQDFLRVWLNHVSRITHRLAAAQRSA